MPLAGQRPVQFRATRTDCPLWCAVGTTGEVAPSHRGVGESPLTRAYAVRPLRAVPCADMSGVLDSSVLSRYPDIMSKDLSAWEAWDQLIHLRDANPLEVLRAASQFQRYFDAVQGAAAKAARGEGSTWDEIGQSLGVSRQAAWERFATSEHEQLRKISLERFCRWPRR